LFKGGTYFRASDPGLPGNNITVEVIEASAPTSLTTGEAYCIFTNQNLQFNENVIGATTKVLDIKGTYQDLWIIDQLNTSPRARRYSISLRIAFLKQQGLPYTLPAPVELGTFTFDKLFTDPGKLSVLLQKKTAGFTSEDTIIIAPRTRMYQLLLVPAPTPDPSAPPPTTSVIGPAFGWDIADLRLKVTASDKWIEMKERSGAAADPVTGVMVPNLSPIDAQDDGVDDPFLSPFKASNLENGDGLPSSPNTEVSGPSRSLVHVNYGEEPNGVLGVHNTVYEWVGDSSIAGSWKAY
jgi:hypothetical protein